MTTRSGLRLCQFRLMKRLTARSEPQRPAPNLIRSIASGNFQLRRLGEKKRASNQLCLVTFSYKKKMFWCFIAALIAPTLHYQLIMQITRLDKAFLPNCSTHAWSPASYIEQQYCILLAVHRNLERVRPPFHIVRKIESDYVMDHKK